MILPLWSERIAHYERALAVTSRDENPDDTLFLQLTAYEVLVLAFGLFWLARMYPEIAEPVVEKFAALIDTQEFAYRPSGGGNEA